jgi:hypothetical protein
MKQCAVILAMGLLVSGCQLAEDDIPDNDIPDGAIQVEPGLYMIPLENTLEGCQAYRAYAPDGMTAQVIYYRAEDGSFTPERSEVQCE